MIPANLIEDDSIVLKEYGGLCRNWSTVVTIPTIVSMDNASKHLKIPMPQVKVASTVRPILLAQHHSKSIALTSQKHSKFENISHNNPTPHQQSGPYGSIRIAHAKERNFPGCSLRASRSCIVCLVSEYHDAECGKGIQGCEDCEGDPPACAVAYVSGDCRAEVWA